MKKIIAYIIFAISCVVIVVAFVTATTYYQLVAATLLYPLVAYFWITLFPRKTRKINAPIQTTAPASEVVASTIESSNSDIADLDKRDFLKLIGAAGFSFFLFSLFTRKAEPLFYGKGSGLDSTSLLDSDGKKINPAEKKPFDGFQICEIDDNAIAYYGFTNKEGEWVIMREDTDTASFRYAKGASDFPSNWQNRENISYDYFHNLY